ncbi:MAG: hypothetical protein H7841_06410 [Magnetospirillum sp. WYHS-4]
MQWSNHLVHPGDERCVCCGGHLPRGQSICPGCRAVIRRAPDLFRLVERLASRDGDAEGLAREAGALLAEIAARSTVPRAAAAC